jgi:predicted MFS family arabinose efflux permease
MLIGSAVDDLGFSEQQAGLLASSYFAGYLLIGVSAFFWIRRISWPRLAIAAYIALASGLGISAFLTDFYGLAVSLFTAGCAAGALFGLGVTIISDTEQPDRNFGFVLATQQLLAALLLFSLPDLVIVPWGFQGLNLVLAAVTLLLGISALWIPGGRSAMATGSVVTCATVSASSGTVWIGLIALTLYFAALSGVWAFLERLAGANGLSISQIGGALAIAMVGGVLGGLAAVVVGARWGRKFPLLGSTLLFVAVFLFYSGGFQTLGFTLATFLFIAAWNYVLAYQMAIISELDRDGRYAVLMPAAQALGAIVGPAVAGMLILAAGYKPLLWVASISIGLAILPFIYLKAQKRPAERAAF